MNRKKIRSFTFHIMLLSFLALSSAAHSRAAGVSLVATPTAQTVNVGQTAVYTIKINRDSYTDKVTLSATALPAGVTASFIPNATTALSSTLKLQTAASTPIGTFNINVKATANGISIAPIIVKLTTQPVPSISLTVSPPSRSIIAGQSTFYDINIKRVNYAGKLTLSAENLPSGVTVVFEPESTYGSSARMFLYSNGLPFLSQSFGMYVRARSPFDEIDKRQSFMLHANSSIQWAAQFGTPDNPMRLPELQDPDFATDVTYDSAGNVYLTGYTYDINTNDFNSWAAKYDFAGNRLWLSLIPGLVNDAATDVFVDAAGNVYVAGNVRSQGLDIFVAKIDPNAANAPSIQIFGTANDEGHGGLQFGVNAAGSTTLTAATRVRSMNGPRDSRMQPSRYFNYDVTRYTFDANFNRTNTTLVTDGSGNPKDLAVGGDGSVYVLSEDHTGIGSSDLLFVVSNVEKFDSSGSQIYRTQPLGLTDEGAFYATTLKVDANGNVYAAGTYFYRAEDLMLYYGRSWLEKINSVGGSAWRVDFLGNQYETRINGLDVDANGNVICAGFTFDSLRGVNPNLGGANPRSDAWFGKFASADGAIMYISQMNVNDKDGFNVVKSGAGSNIYFAGYTVNFKRVNYGYEDALLIRCNTLLCGYLP